MEIRLASMSLALLRLACMSHPNILYMYLLANLLFYYLTDAQEYLFYSLYTHDVKQAKGRKFLKLIF